MSRAADIVGAAKSDRDPFAPFRAVVSFSITLALWGTVARHEFLRGRQRRERFGDHSRPHWRVDLFKGFEFGHIIAFLLPGFVATRAMAYYLPFVQDTLDRAVRGGDGSVGAGIFYVTVAATVGLTISILRQVWLDRWFGWLHENMKLDVPFGRVLHLGRRARRCQRDSRSWWPGTWSWQPTKDEEAELEKFVPGSAAVNYQVLRRSKELLETFGQSVNQVYRYYQFVGNMGIATLLLAVARWHFQHAGVRKQVMDAAIAAKLSAVKAASAAASAATATPLLTETELTVATFAGGAVLIGTAFFHFRGWCSVHNRITANYDEPSKPTTLGSQSA
jgi:hypothetical protein